MARNSPCRGFGAWCCAWTDRRGRRIFAWQGSRSYATANQRAQGESLFNDASGIVGFQFAIAAAISGVFEVGDSAAQFVFSFFGGAIFGLAVGMVADMLFETLRSFGWETTTSRILMELFLPFILYLGAEAVHVSGILSVVTAGLIIRFDRTGIGPECCSHQHCFVKRMGGILVYAQRHGVHSAWHAAAECDERKLG